jgi:cytochrome c peroxidase
MHNGAFTSLEAAIRHHLDAVASARSYNPVSQGLAPDLTGPTGPIDAVLAHLDPLLATPKALTDAEFDDLVAFVRYGLLDPRAKPAHLRKLIPHRVPSGRPTLTFEFPHARR